MNKRDAYRKGIKDISESYHRRFNEISEWMIESQEKQKKDNERTHRMVGELADNQEQMDQDLDRLYDLVGDVRPGTSGSAVILPNSQQTIVGYTDGMLNKYNSLSNLEAIKFDSRVADAIAGFLTVSVEKDMNRKFHKNLSVLEQNGLLRQEDFDAHKARVERAKFITGLGVYTAFSLAPIVIQSIQTFLQKQDMIDFIVGVYAYINQEITPGIQLNIRKLLVEMGIEVDDAKIVAVFQKYRGQTGLSQLPLFSRRNRGLVDARGMELLAKDIISRCDLMEVEIRNRASEFIEDFLRMDISSTEQLLSESKLSQESVSDMTWFSTINYRYIFADFIKNVSMAQEFAAYDLANDPYRRIREERQQTMEEIVHKTSRKKGLFLTTGKRKDIILASGRMMQYSLNPDYDISMDAKMVERECKILEHFGLRY